MYKMTKEQYKNLYDNLVDICLYIVSTKVLIPHFQYHHWVGTVVLTCCEAIERPSSKEGYCFKLFHPLKESIWSTKAGIFLF